MAKVYRCDKCQKKRKKDHLKPMGDQSHCWWCIRSTNTAERRSPPPEPPQPPAALTPAQLRGEHLTYSPSGKCWCGQDANREHFLRAHAQQRASYRSIGSAVCA